MIEHKINIKVRLQYTVIAIQLNYIQKRRIVLGNVIQF